MKKLGVTSVINNLHLSNNSTIGNNDLGDSLGSPLTPAINFSSAYAFKTIEDLNNYHLHKRDNTRYARDSNNLTRQVEEYFSHFYNGHPSFIFSSGMSAIATALGVLLPKVSNVVTFGIYYRKTESLIKENCMKLGLNHITCGSYEDVLSLEIKGKTLFFVENFSNPFLRVVNIPSLRKVFPDSKILLDFTLQGLMNNSNELEYADISVSSCTKYIGGHNDLLAGVLYTSDPNLVEEVWSHRSAYGSILDSFSAYFLLRSLRTYDLRIDKILTNTKKTLDLLSESNTIETIYYPFAFNNDDQASLSSAYSHSGGLISFKVKDHIKLEDNLEHLCSIKMAPSFGSIDSLIEIPLYMSQQVRGNNDSRGEYESVLISNRFVRLSVGCEPFEYLNNDLKKLFR
jgi:cystathionine beta-lyase/cystathionine gamma-synthase